MDGWMDGWMVGWLVGFFPSEVDSKGQRMQVCTVVPNILSLQESSFSAIVSPQRLENVLGNKTGKTQLEKTLMDGKF